MEEGGGGRKGREGRRSLLTLLAQRTLLLLSHISLHSNTPPSLHPPEKERHSNLPSNLKAAARSLMYHALKNKKTPKTS